MSRLAVTLRAALFVAAAALAGGCDHVERKNLDPARETWADAGAAMRNLALELRTRQQALAGRVEALRVPDGVDDRGLASVIEALKGQIPTLDEACAEVERALAQTTTEVEFALSKPNKVVAKQIVDAGLARFETASTAATRMLSQVTPQVENAEAAVQRHLDALAASGRRYEALAASGGALELTDLAFRPGTAELDITRPATRTALDRLVGFAGACDQLRFALTGTVPAGGTPAAALAAGKARADAVRTYLIGAGVTDTKIVGTQGAAGEAERVTLTVTAPCTATPAPTALPPTAPPPGAAGAAVPTVRPAAERAATQPTNPARPVRATQP